MNHFLELILVVGIFPMLFYTYVLWWIDLWEPEPLRLIAFCLFWGAVPALLISMWLYVPLHHVLQAAELPYSGGSAAFLTSPIVEEVSKLLGLFLLLACFQNELDTWMDGIIFGSAIGFGFAAAENVAYFLHYADSNPGTLLVVMFFRTFAFGLNHAFFASFLGLGIFEALRSRTWLASSAWTIMGLAVAITLHATHNWLVDTNKVGTALVADWLGVVWIVAIAVTSLKLEHQRLSISLKEEVELGTVPQENAERVCDWKTRMWFFNENRELHQLLAELSLMKQLAKRSAPERIEPVNSQVAGLRQKIRALSTDDPT